MSEEIIVQQCAPTLAGIKTGNLFPYWGSSKEKLQSDIRAFNKKFTAKGLCLLPLRFTGNFALLYLFRPADLKRDLGNNTAKCILKQSGYECSKCEQCLVKLAQRFRENKDFPHEIGLFLSYPPEDVKGFIDNHAKNYKLTGLWKVYGDENLALNLFAKYNACSAAYYKLWQAGIDFDKLAVAV